MTEPKHIGIIMDGNRRFAKKLLLKPWKGHELGANKVKEIIEWCLELKIKEITLYTLSIQNINSRPKEELDFLMKLFKDGFDKIKNDKNIHDKKIRINFIGRLEMLDKELQNTINTLMNKTKDYNNLTINFAVAYGGRSEIVDAVKKIATEVKENKLNIKEINEETILNKLYIKEEPDLIIRTGGDFRTSNFLPFQSTYSEWFFLKKLFPELNKEDLSKCIEQFKDRNRRFGK